MNMYDMKRDGKKVAEVVVSAYGRCVVVWPTSTIIYDSEAAARQVHIDHMGGRGEKTVFQPVDVVHEAFERGALDAVQDRYENCPFASVGGLDKRGMMTVPDFITAGDASMYLAGYVYQSRMMFGADWQTCSFEWSPAITIGDDGAPETRP